MDVSWNSVAAALAGRAGFLSGAQRSSLAAPMMIHASRPLKANFTPHLRIRQYVF
jgi:hypothetical protein